MADELIYRMYYPYTDRASEEFSADASNAYQIVADAVQKSEQGDTKAILQRKLPNGEWEDRLTAEIPYDQMDKKEAAKYAKD